jgi:hypothetical protein
MPPVTQSTLVDVGAGIRARHESTADMSRSWNGTGTLLS